MGAKAAMAGEEQGRTPAFELMCTGDGEMVVLQCWEYRTGESE